MPEDTTTITGAPFATVVESDVEVVVDRLMTWGVGAYGSHAETAVHTPSTTWYLAEGATGWRFSLFYLLQNPSDTDAQVEQQLDHLLLFMCHDVTLLQEAFRDNHVAAECRLPHR